MPTINSNATETDVYERLGLTRPQQGGSNNDLGQADFLKLLTEQLAHQDPTAPTDNKEFIAQMAQFSSVDSLQSLERKFDDLSTSLTSTQALQASTMVGRDVIVPGNVAFNSGNGVGGKMHIEGNAANVQVEIVDSNNQVVDSFYMGDQSGDVSFYWDGKDENGQPFPEGHYFIRASGEVFGQGEQFATSVVAKVESVNFSQSGQGIMLNLFQLGSIDLKEVKEIG
jgi:flagellar basal-body rod modification protein FlgD